MRVSKKSNALKHSWWGSVLALGVGVCIMAPSVGAEQANLKLQILPPGCQVSQVIENGETKDVYTPTGCNEPAQPSSPDTTSEVPPVGTPSFGQTNGVSQLLQDGDLMTIPGGSPTSSNPSSPASPLTQPPVSNGGSKNQKPAAAPQKQGTTVVTVVLGTAAAVGAGVGVAVGVHAVVAATTTATTAAGSSAVGGIFGITRRMKKKKRR